MEVNGAVESMSLFDNTNFAIISSEEITESLIAQIRENITRNGGTVVYVSAEDKKPLELETIDYIISSNIDFPEYNLAEDAFLPVVKPNFIDQCLGKRKMVNPRQYSPHPSMFMSNIVVTCVDIPKGDLEAIVGGVLQFGGTHSPGVSKQTTHLITLSMENAYARLVVKKGLKCKIVLPHWFDSCLRLGRLISEGPYQHPDPEILSSSFVAKVGKLKVDADRNLEGALSPVSKPYPIEQTESIPPKGVFEEKAIMFSNDLDLTDHFSRSIAAVIEKSEGKTTTDVQKADMYVCQFREGSDYFSAVKRGIDVGNLTWFYFLLSHDKWTSPMKRLMHYPIPRKPLPGFENAKISISGFQGNARLYLENLVKAAGAQFTKDMRSDNTHLVAAHTQSEKCITAKEWGLHVINHLWLEESYARCKALSVSNSQFVTFPHRVNLTEVVGQRPVDRDVIGKEYPEVSSRGKVKNVPAINSAKQPHQSKNGSSILLGDDEVDVKNAPKKNGDRLHNVKKSPSLGEGAAQTPKPNRKGDGKENDTPPTTGSRGAKNRALSKIHNSAQDVALFQKEMKRKGGVLHGRERRKSSEVDMKDGSDEDSDNAAKGRRESNKRPVETEDESEEDEEVVTAQKPRKKSKPLKAPIEHYMVLTKYEKWDVDAKAAQDDKAKLRDMGILVTDDTTKATLLCAPKIIRTFKFLAALASAPTVVDQSFLDQALKLHQLPDPEDHSLVDSMGEKQYNFNLNDAVQRARENRRRLLRGWNIFCTDGVKGGFDTYKSIVEVNGGECNLWKGQSNFRASHRSFDSSEADGGSTQEEGDMLFLISEPKKSEVPQWTKFRDLAEKHNMVPKIVTPEWLLMVALKQSIVSEDQYLIDEKGI